MPVLFCGPVPQNQWSSIKHWSQWCERGPKGTIYFTLKRLVWHFTVCKWGYEVMLPHLRKLPSKEMLVSDSHSFYISTSVIQNYKVNQIEFICLPCWTAPTSCIWMTLVSGPLKAAWRLILTEYKSNNQLQAGILKTDFPCLLVKLCPDKPRTVPA